MVANILLRYNKVRILLQYFRSGYLDFSWERMGAGVPPGLQNRVWRLWALGGFDSYPFPPAFVNSRAIWCFSRRFHELFLIDLGSIFGFSRIHGGKLVLPIPEIFPAWIMAFEAEI